MTLAALVRALTPIVHVEWYLGSLMVSGMLWILAFLLLLGDLGPMLLRLRVDRHAG